MYHIALGEEIRYLKPEGILVPDHRCFYHMVATCPLSRVAAVEGEE